MTSVRAPLLDPEDVGGISDDLHRPSSPSMNDISDHPEDQRKCSWLSRDRLPSWPSKCQARLKLRIVAITVSLVLCGVLLISYILGNSVSNKSLCDTIEGGYQCHSQISHFWGQYSPFFSLGEESQLSPDIPEGCQVTFVQVLSRHGARYPTTSKTRRYSKLINRIQRATTSFNGEFVFLRDYVYNLGANSLTPFGETQMINSGIKLYNRYRTITRHSNPFVRCSGSDRVIASGQRFVEGFQIAKIMDPHSNRTTPVPQVNVIIEEGISFNNTLDGGSCPLFESKLGHDMQNRFAETFVPTILKRVTANLPGAELSASDVLYLMDMCPFDTVAGDTEEGHLSLFCSLFTEREWRSYDYYQALGKYYGHGAGNSLGAAQGIGFVNELIARMTHTPVHDHTNVNQTLDSDPETFPLSAKIYADFSHDNTMVSILTALNLYNNGTKESPMDGYSASWTVPFAARTYIEMMKCASSTGHQQQGELEEEPLVRVLVNDRVVPLQGCKTDPLGRCRRADFVQSLSFARDGGNWESCYA